MEKKEQNHGLTNGFFVGVIVGVIITLLFTTKRGKKIFKFITEEGMSKISHWEDIFTDIVDDYQTNPQESKLPSVDLASDSEIEQEPEILNTEGKEEHIEKKEAKPIRRFFKGIHRPSVN